MVRTDLAEDDAGFEACDDGDEDETNGCKNDCTPQVCGDGVVGLGEGFDDGIVDPDVDCDGCRPKICGDGILGPEELCDDGNEIDTDECTNQCAPAACGDGFCVRTSTTRGTLSRSVMTATP